MMRIFSRVLPQRDKRLDDEVYKVLQSKGVFDAEKVNAWLKRNKASNGGAVHMSHLTKWPMMHHVYWSYWNTVMGNIMRYVPSDGALEMVRASARIAARRVSNEASDIGMQARGYTLDVLLLPPDNIAGTETTAMLSEALRYLTTALSAGSGAMIDEGEFFRFCSSVLGTQSIDSIAGGPWRDHPMGPVAMRWMKHSRDIPIDVVPGITHIMRGCIQDSINILYQLEQASRFPELSSSSQVPLDDQFSPMVEYLLFQEVLNGSPLWMYMLGNNRPEVWRAVYLVTALLMGKPSNMLMASKQVLLSNIMPAGSNLSSLEDIELPVTWSTYLQTHTSYMNSVGTAGVVSGAVNRLFGEKVELFSGVPHDRYQWLKEHHQIKNRFSMKLHGYFLPPNTQAKTLNVMANLARCQAEMAYVVVNKVIAVLYAGAFLLQETIAREQNPGKAKMSTHLTNRLTDVLSNDDILCRTHDLPNMVSGIVSEWCARMDRIIMKPQKPTDASPIVVKEDKIPDGRALYFRVETAQEAHAMLGELPIDFGSCFSGVGENASHPFRLYGSYPSYVVYLSSSPGLLNDSLKEALPFIEVRWWGIAGMMPVVPKKEGTSRFVPFVFGSNAYADMTPGHTAVASVLSQFHGTSAVRKGEIMLACTHHMTVDKMHTLGTYTGDIYGDDSPIMSDDTVHKINNLYANVGQQCMLIGGVTEVDWEASYDNLMALYNQGVTRALRPGDTNKQKQLLQGSTQLRVDHPPSVTQVLHVQFPFTSRSYDSGSAKRTGGWQRYQGLIFNGWRYTQLALSPEGKGEDIYGEYALTLTTQEKETLTNALLTDYHEVLYDMGLGPLTALLPVNPGVRGYTTFEGFIRCSDCGGVIALPEARHSWRWIYFHEHGYFAAKGKYYPRRQSLCSSCAAERCNPYTMYKPAWDVNKQWLKDDSVPSGKLYVPSGWENRGLVSGWREYREQTHNQIGDSMITLHAAIHAICYMVLRRTIYEGARMPETMAALAGAFVPMYAGLWKAGIPLRITSEVINAFGNFAQMHYSTRHEMVGNLNEVCRILTALPGGTKFANDLHTYLSTTSRGGNISAPKLKGSAWDEGYLAQFLDPNLSGGAKRKKSGALEDLASMTFRAPSYTIGQMAGQAVLGGAPVAWDPIPVADMLDDPEEDE